MTHDLRASPSEVAFEAPRCDTCGLEITTGMMIAFCPLFEDCEFWEDEWDENTKEWVRSLWEDFK